MKTKSFYIIIFILFLTLGCSKGDDNNDTTTPILQTEVIESFDPISIKFVQNDGTDIGQYECITSNAAYNIQIETTRNSQGNTQVTKVDYTINGALFSMSFSQAGFKRNPISLVNGKNIAELVKTAVTAEVSYTIQDDFELVN